MRLPYIPPNPQFQNAEDQAIVSRVKQRRGSGGLIELDRALLHAPPVADGWNSFLASIRTRTTLSPSIRETAICRVAVLNKAWYEWTHHAPLLLSAPGITQEHVDTVRNSPEHQIVGDVLDEKHGAVMAYTDAMTLSVTVDDETFARLKEYFTDKEVVEITATIAAYNCVSRFLVALDVGEMNGKEEPVPEA
ncbi:4-carboxymuconolactone decarboxylase-like protein [Byssothecium circinans]|uniref:4-carboxymuconolactone decarboxylase-like protein n=1 Tax=Byssothecium circinans TaxID=147558 RepID=A0A6A5TZQ0_9PLEO|nr:4-carboxymuconolactone decarboxylase-like protein [Byssothecium circinans]